jgi:hypothetical protein
MAGAVVEGETGADRSVETVALKNVRCLVGPQNAHGRSPFIIDRKPLDGQLILL